MNEEGGSDSEVKSREERIAFDLAITERVDEDVGADAGKTQCRRRGG